LKVAIVHYWLVGMRGGEKVLEAMCEMFPDADVFTHVYAPDRTSDIIKRHRITTSWVSRLPNARRWYKKYLPFMPAALEALDLQQYDLVISMESGPAKGIIPNPRALHVCYCHTPMRYLWDQYNEYYASAGIFTKAAMTLLGGWLRMWDVTTASRVDVFVANSANVRRRIQRYYHRDAAVVHPPVDVDRFSIADAPGDFYLHVGQLVRYKRVDLSVDACTRLGRRLVVIGDGDELARLRRRAGPTIEFLGWQSDEVVAKYYRECRALLFPGEEDFGIVPVECQASGRPVIALARGGALETVTAPTSGILFEKQTVEGLTHAILDFERDEQRFDSQRLRQGARVFSKDRFLREMRTTLSAALESHGQALPGVTTSGGSPRPRERQATA
jgi:glycosyltransferase involved in cell wall biosynthesis